MASFMAVCTLRVGLGLHHWEGKGTTGMALFCVLPHNVGGPLGLFTVVKGISLQFWCLANDRAKQAALL